MAKIDVEEFKRALIAAEEKRLSVPSVQRPDPAQYPKLLKAKQAGEQFLAEFFHKAGFDIEKFAAIQKQYNTELQRVVDKQKAEAIKRARGAKDTVHSSVRSQRDALQLIAGNAGFFPFPLVTLEKPFLILATPHNNIISDSQIIPFNSWAKIKVEVSDSDGTGTQKLSFYYMWDNPSDFYAVINAATSMSATGHLEATATGGLSGIDPTARYSTLGTNANLSLWSWWQQSPVATPEDSQGIAGVNASASFTDSTETASVSDGATLHKDLFIVPPKGVVVLEAAFKVTYDISDGNAVADFESGDFKVTSPVAVVSILTQAPMTSG